jgi:hypothetical protein
VPADMLRERQQRNLGNHPKPANSYHLKTGQR